MKMVILALTICFWKTETHYYYDDGFGFDRTTTCADSGQVTLKGKHRITDSTVIVRNPGSTTFYYWYKCPQK